MTTVDLPYRVRYSNGRDICTKCRSEIPKGAVQLAVMQQSMTDDCMEPKWYEQGCFFQVRLPAFETVIDGFANLRHTHQVELRKQLCNDAEQPPEKKCSFEGDSSLEKQTQAQNKEFFEIRGKLKFNTKKDDRVAILEANGQYVPEGNSEILNHVTDVICFGAMTPCSVCKSGMFVFKNSIYCCTGNVSEWSKCRNTVDEPRRIPVKIPEKYQKFLRGNLEVRARILMPVPEINDEDFELQVKQPLFGMEFFIIGETIQSHEAIEKKIRQMGGRVAKEIHENVTAVISNADEVIKMGNAMQSAKTFKIDVVPEEFIDQVKDNDPMKVITKYELSDWGKDLYKRLPKRFAAVVDDQRPSTSGVARVQHLQVKYGGVVDPDSKVADIAHVCSVGDLLYCAILDFVDISSNKNSYFKMQLLESDSESTYWLFESKGRIATLIGSVNVKSFNNFYDADQAFKKLYLEKTGNVFGKPFVKMPGKYNQMEKNLDSVPRHEPNRNYVFIPPRLNASVCRLLQLIFDTDIMKSALLGFDLDVEKMPLGEISKQQIDSAMSLLVKISLCLKNSPKSITSNEIIAASNQFYSKIPHNFGLRRPAVINTPGMIEEKYKMLYALQQMEIAYHIITEGAGANVNPIDAYYAKLSHSVRISALNPATEEYAEIREYVENTQQIPVGYELVEAFAVSRSDEVERFRHFEGTPNRQLLWHGTRVTNFVGILTNGLKKPPHRHTGLFGQGIYFSDALAKSLRYCRNPDRTTHLLLLCEVALGHSELASANFGFPTQTTQPTNCDSLKGCGKCYPQSTHTRADGLLVPNGKLVVSENVGFQLQYNEYVVFDESRVKIRYVIELNSTIPRVL